MSSSPAEIFLRLVEGVSARRWDSLPELYAETAVVDHPLSPGLPRLRGREDLRRHFVGAGQATGDLRFEPADVRIHPTADPEVIVAEFEYRGVNTVTGAPLAAPGVFILRVRDGRIVESRDYLDHAAFARALAPAA